ncbi:MAG: ATP-binding cassette domain-containing protein [Acidimicrobiales bacterium]
MVGTTPLQAIGGQDRARRDDVSAERVPLLVGASKAYGRAGTSGHLQVLRDFTLLVRPASCTALVAPNGSGKSTVARAILGVEELDAGECAPLTAADLRSAVLQDYRGLLLPHASVRTNLALPFRRVAEKERRIATAEQHLEALGYDLSAGATVGQLSGGQQQSIVLARALAASGALLVWDEATTAMDYRRRRLLYELLWRLWARPAAPTVLLITHDIDEALLLATDVLVLDAQLEVIDQVEVETPVTGRTLSLLHDPTVRDARDRVRSAMLGDGRA